MRKATSGLAAWAAMLAVLVPASIVHAAPGLNLVTPYPAVVVEAGKSSSFNIEVETPTRRRVNLDIIETPPGWQANLNGGGFTINGVFGAPDDPPTVQLNVTVPAGAAEGDHRVLVRGNAGGAIDVLEVNLRVAKVVAGAVTLTAEFPTLKGAADKTFNFKLTLTNNSPEETTFSLSAQGPQGWPPVTARPQAEEQATTVTVEGGGTGEIQVDADPPDGVAAAPYPIVVVAEGGGKKAEATVNVEITGSFELSFTGANERLNTEAVAGKETEFQMQVKNEGSTTISEVKLSSSPPNDWKVTFSPSTLKNVKPNETARTVAKITPSANAVAGDYQLDMTATGEGATESADVRVSVKTSRLFGLLGLLVIGAAIYILFRVFGQYGRR